MKMFKNQARQGDCLITKIDEFPNDLTVAVSENGQLVLAHSETGHNHVVKEKYAQLLIDEANDFIAYLNVEEETELKHLRSFHTHESIMLPKGKYEVRRQREHMPKGWRKAQD